MDEIEETPKKVVRISAFSWDVIEKVKLTETTKQAKKMIIKKRENIFQIQKEHTKDIISLLIVFIFGFVQSKNKSSSENRPCRVIDLNTLDEAKEMKYYKRNAIQNQFERFD